MTTTTETLELEFPIMRYDITLPLFDGRVEIEGVKLKPARIPAMVFHDDLPYKDGNFGVGDLNVGYWPAAIEAGWQLIGLPLFIKRKPIYEYIFCRAGAGIESPKDLEGKRIGAGQYRVSTTIWLRGLLQHRHGVDVSKLRWLVGSHEVFPIHDAGANIDYAADPGQKNMVERLLDGEVDAIITDISDRNLFQTLETSPSVRRLFPDYMAEDEGIYREAGLFPSAHLIVVSRTLDRQHPELAGKLYAAFEQAKQIAYNDILDDRAGFSVVYLRERMKEQIERWGDPWKYGIRQNKEEIDAFIQYNQEQGMTKGALAYEQLFAGSTLKT